MQKSIDLSEYKNNKNQSNTKIQIQLCKQPTLYTIIHTICVLLAIYFSFKRNNGFSLGSFLAASMAPQIYILYVLATDENLKNLYPGMKGDQYLE